MQSTLQTKFNRIDYTQVGLTSKNAFRFLRTSGQLADVVIGDYSGSLHSLVVRLDSNQTETVFKTLPGPNAKINCVEIFTSPNSSSCRILAAYGSSTIKGYNKKGKQFFSLELNNLTEPIRLFKVRWPEEIYVVGQFIYNSYMINSDQLDKSGNTNSNTSVKSRHYYVCPEKINDFILIEEKMNSKLTPVLACQDRLLRVLKYSSCNFEVEVCGIPSVIQVVPKHLVDASKPNDLADGFKSVENDQQQEDNCEEIHLCYGTLDGKIALVTFRFIGKNQLEPIHKWEVPVNAIKQPITCLCFSEINPEFYVGRSDGSIEVWRLAEKVSNDNVQSVDLFSAPTMTDNYNCGESVTNILSITVNDQPETVLLCATFTGLIFGLIRRSEEYSQIRQLNPNYLVISEENAAKIESLKDECDKLEKKLTIERERYERQTKSSNQNLIDVPDDLSALPFFAINDSFVLYNDASYVLMLEVEVAIDVVILHCDILLDLIDCERNSAVISFNESSDLNPHEVLVTFRCQANTTRLEIRIRPVEGQHGTLSVYVISRITPKSCQTRSYAIQPLALHKRQYSNTQIDFANRLEITGQFGINDAHTWLRLCIPEVPEKLTLTLANVESEVLYYISTMTKSILICNCGRGIITFMSDNVSTISILKDFIAREATSQSTQIEINVEIEERSIAVMLRHLYPKIKSLILEKQRQELSEAISDLQTSDTDIAVELFRDLHIDHQSLDSATTTTVKPGSGSSTRSELENVQIGLDRIYGIITDLFIDYHKLKGSSRSAMVTAARQKLSEMVTLIEGVVLDSTNSAPNIDSIIKMNEAEWGLMMDGGDDGDEDNNGQSKKKMVKKVTINGQSAKDDDLFIQTLYHFWDIQIN